MNKPPPHSRDFSHELGGELFKVCKCLNLSIDFFSEEVPKVIHLHDPKKIQVITKCRELKDMQTAVDKLLSIE